MAKKTTIAAGAKKKAGRPPTGENGALVSQYQHQISARIPGETSHLLTAAVFNTPETPQWKILQAAITAYVDSLSRADRDKIRADAEHQQARCPKCKA